MLGFFGMRLPSLPVELVQRFTIRANFNWSMLTWVGVVDGGLPLVPVSCLPSVPDVWAYMCQPYAVLKNIGASVKCECEFLVMDPKSKLRRRRGIADLLDYSARLWGHVSIDPNVGKSWTCCLQSSVANTANLDS